MPGTQIPEDNRNRFEAAGSSDTFEGAPKRQPKNRQELQAELAQLSANQDKADQIRAQLAAMDRGEIPVIPQQLKSAEQPAVRDVAKERNMTPKILAGVLNQEIDIKKVSEVGAGYDEVQQLIENAANNAEENKN